jgi:hypothetical protein
MEILFFHEDADLCNCRETDCTKRAKYAILCTVLQLTALPEKHAISMLKLFRRHLPLGKEVKLTPGMVAVVEIKTGKRKLIEFLLSPLMRMKDEAGRER